MKDLCITVYAPTAKTRNQSHQLRLPWGTSLHAFRQKCSELFELDVLTVLGRGNRRITDIEELERESEVLVHDGFYSSPLKTSSNSFTILTELADDRLANEQSLEPGERRSSLTLRIETIGPPRAGKTSLIWRFVKNERLSSDTNAVTEAVFEKSLDQLDQSVRFCISDVKESEELWWAEERVRAKRVLLFCVPKTDLPALWEQVAWRMKEARRVNPEALLVLAITKSDLKSLSRPWTEDKRLINILTSLQVLVVPTSIFETHGLHDVLTADELFAMIAEHCMQPRRSDLRLWSAGDNRSQRRKPVPRAETLPIQPEPNFWLLASLRAFTDCFNRSTQ